MSAPSEPDPSIATQLAEGDGGTVDGGRSGVRNATRWNAVGKAIVTAIRWFVQIWLLRMLDVEDFGDMAVAVSFGGLLLLFAEFGTGQAVIQRKQLDEAFLSTVFWLNIVLGLALFGSVWLASSLVAASHGRSTQTSILPVLALSFAILSAGIVQRSLLARRLSFDKISLISVVEAVTYGIVSIWLALAGYGIWALVIGTTAGSAGAVIGQWVLNGWRPQFMFRWLVIREVWGFSIHLLGARVAGTVFLEADRVVIYAMLGSEATGYYYAAQQLIVFPIATITQVLAGVLVPAFARLQADLPEFRRLLTRALGGVAFIIAPVLFGMAAVLDPTIGGFLNDPTAEVSKWGPALVPALLLVPASFLRSLFITTASVYVAMGRTKLMLQWTLVLGISLIGSYLMGAALFGLVGVAAGFTLTHLVLAPKLLQTVAGLVELRLRAVVDAVVPAVALAVGMASSVFVLELALDLAALGDRERALIGVAAGALVYGVGAVIVRPRAFDDMLELTGLGALAGKRRGRRS